MQRWVFRLLGLLLCAAPLAAQRPDSTLAGITAIRLRVTLNSHTQTAIEIDTTMLKRQVVHDLTAHGWRVALDGEDSTASWPTFLVAVEVFEYHTGAATVYLTRYDYGLVERAMAISRHAPPVAARTWTGPTQLEANDNPRAVFPTLLGTIRGIVAKFNAARGPIGRRA